MPGGLKAGRHAGGSQGQRLCRGVSRQADMPGGLKAGRHACSSGLRPCRAAARLLRTLRTRAVRVQARCCSDCSAGVRSLPTCPLSREPLGGSVLPVLDTALGQSRLPAAKRAAGTAGQRGGGGPSETLF